MDIRKIAEKAGVSVATVSRVQNHPEAVAPATREKVQAIIEECGYTPNWFARGMHSGKADTIGLLIPDVLNPSYMEVVKGIEEVLYEKGYTTLICDSNYNPKKEKDLLDNLIKRRVDGLIVLSSSLDKKKLLTVQKQNMPIVSIGESNGGKLIHTVKIDYKKASRQAVEHLIGIGYKDIAIIIGTEAKRKNKMRLEAYEEVMEEVGIPVRNDYIIHTDITMESGYSSVQKLMKLKKPPKAIFATDDLLAMGVMAALRDEGFEIPQDIAVVGFDDVTIVRMVESKLTTIVNPLHMQGVMGARLLLDLIDGDKENVPMELLLETRLKIRKSCGYKR